MMYDLGCETWDLRYYNNTPVYNSGYSCFTLAILTIFTFKKRYNGVLYNDGYTDFFIFISHYVLKSSCQYPCFLASTYMEKIVLMAYCCCSAECREMCEYTLAMRSISGISIPRCFTMFQSVLLISSPVWFLISGLFILSRLSLSSGSFVCSCIQSSLFVFHSPVRLWSPR